MLTSLFILEKFSDDKGIILISILGLLSIIGLLSLGLYVIAMIRVSLSKDNSFTHIPILIKISHIIPHVILLIIEVFLCFLLFTIGVAFIFFIGQLIIFLFSSLLSVTILYKNKEIFNKDGNFYLYLIMLFIPMLDILSSVIIHKIYKRNITEKIVE